MPKVYSIIFKLNSTEKKAVEFYTFENRKAKISKLKQFFNNLNKVEFEPKQKSVDKLIKFIYE